MNRSLVPIAALLSLGMAAPQALAQAQTQPAPVVSSPNPSVPSAGSLTTRASVTGQITQTASSAGGSAPGQQTVDVASVVGLSVNVPNSVSTNGTLVGSITQTRSPGGTDTAALQAVRVGSVHGSIQAARVQTTSLVNANVTQSTQTAAGASNGSTSGQLVDAGSVSDSTGGLLEALSQIAGSVSQSQTRSINQEVRVGSIRDTASQGARAVGITLGSITQTGTAGAGAGLPGSQSLHVGAIEGLQAQSVATFGLLNGTLTQTQTGTAQQIVSIGVARGGNNAVAGSVRTAGSAVNVVQSADGPQSQVVAVADVSLSPANSASASGVISRTVTQSATGAAAGSQRIDVGRIVFAGGNVETDAVVSATLTQVRTGGGVGAQQQSVDVGGARGTTGVVRTRARVDGSITQVAAAGNGIHQSIEIGTVRSSGANVSTDASFSGDIVQSNQGAANQRQAIRIGSVTPNN